MSEVGTSLCARLAPGVAGNRCPSERVSGFDQGINHITRIPSPMHVHLRRRMLARIVAASLAVGLAVAAVSYLGTSLTFPGPPRASVDVLRERGADGYFAFCSWPKFEPRFWPECVGGADDWRARGADRMVAFCTERKPSRMFDAADCLSDEQPGPVLTTAPRPQDAAAGGVATLGTLAVLGIVTSSVATRRGRRAATEAASPISPR